MRFAVIVPVHNRDQSLDLSLSSIAAQHLKPFQVVVIDDCSDERFYLSILTVVFKYKSVLNITFERNSSNLGPSLTRNIGIGLVDASVTHIAFLDSDDTWKPSKLDILKQTFTSHQCQVVLHAFSLPGKAFDDINTDGNKVMYQSHDVKILPTLIQNPCQTSCLSFLASTNLSFPLNQRYSEDYSLVLSALADGFKCMYLTSELAVLGRPQLTKGGLSSNRNMMRLGEIKAYASYFKKIKQAWLIPFFIFFSVCKHIVSGLKCFVF